MNLRLVEWLVKIQPLITYYHLTDDYSTRIIQQEWKINQEELHIVPLSAQ
jgi:hypothetical protein